MVNRIDLTKRKDGYVISTVEPMFMAWYGRYLGVCGVGVEMVELQELLRNYEETYNLKIDLINADGLIQVDSDMETWLKVRKTLHLYTKPNLLH